MQTSVAQETSATTFADPPVQRPVTIPVTVARTITVSRDVTAQRELTFTTAPVSYRRTAHVSTEDRSTLQGQRSDSTVTDGKF